VQVDAPEHWTFRLSTSLAVTMQETAFVQITSTHYPFWMSTLHDFAPVQSTSTILELVTATTHEDPAKPFLHIKCRGIDVSARSAAITAVTGLSLIVIVQTPVPPEQSTKHPSTLSHVVMHVVLPRQSTVGCRVLVKPDAGDSDRVLVQD
jgi:hypothetical protein